ncbi:DUF58 domain-containing protein [Komagataeibacter intermedius]|uniref:DUF58 domain-containing protein n=2 Tax=Komagataeibacter intermedius TaxID=66229 RepID=A0A0N0MGQ7_9PROT|nr:DUF58 domain-containing protein [Komagataeibacter intermedius]KPH89053.1 hypothetical protein GLUCOINTEAF2_0200187 [Komagataeibacter intermedius AF2]MCF3635120.1 DUF58 domain-containing protein [Komagataeibacter intermedius]GAN87641.1 hypothetical protein Gain_0074_072 [Komagataeibacter intermedius TF2]GBQ65985.1 hypothetical protein AA0521_0600 [Komagataeibacter intermedius NRIC 0521]
MRSPLSFLTRLSGRTRPGPERAVSPSGPAGGGSPFLPRHPVAATALADSLASRLPALIVAARRIAQNAGGGPHPRRKAGVGEEFWQYRPATPGEAATHIDWRQSARGDRAFVREHEAQTPHTICIWCDNSASMRWRSADSLPLKAERAFLLALACAAMLLRQGEDIRLLGTTGAQPLRLRGRQALERMAHALIAALRTTVDEPGLPLPAAIPARSRVLLFGDGLYPVPQLSAFLRAATARQAACTLVEIIDPAETTLPYEGHTRFTGLEDETTVLLNGDATLRHEYSAVWTRHQDQLRTVCQAAGSPPVPHLTDQPPEQALLALHALPGMGNRP